MPDKQPTRLHRATTTRKMKTRSRRRGINLRREAAGRARLPRILLQVLRSPRRIRIRRKRRRAAERATKMRRRKRLTRRIKPQRRMKKRRSSDIANYISPKYEFRGSLKESGLRMTRDDIDV